MKESFKKYIGWILAVVITVMVVVFCFFRTAVIGAAVRKLISILMPIIVGIVIAYVLSPAYNWLRRRLRRLFRNTFHWRGRRAIYAANICGMLITFVGAGAIIVGLLALIIPQLITSISGIATSLPSNLMRASQTLQRLLESNPDIEAQAMTLYAQGVNYVEQWVQESLAPSIQDAFGYVSVGIMGTVTVAKNLLIGIIVAIYLLSGKEHFIHQLTRCVYAVFGARWGNLVMEHSRYANQVFNGFIGGKLLDSAIIFLICCVILPVMNMPYVMLIAVIIGITNIIPFFGPFIGAIPSFVLILMDSPIKSLYFLIFIVVLQQFDGNILGPKILGNSTGLSSFWVLFAILLFGGLFGFVGMLVGVPVFAVLQHIGTDLVAAALKNKQLPAEIDAYAGIDHMDEQSGQAVHYEGRTVPARKQTSTAEKQGEHDK